MAEAAKIVEITEAIEETKVVIEIKTDAIIKIMKEVKTISKNGRIIVKQIAEIITEVVEIEAISIETTTRNKIKTVRLSVHKQMTTLTKKIITKIIIDRTVIEATKTIVVVGIISDNRKEIKITRHSSKMMRNSKPSIIKTRTNWLKTMVLHRLSIDQEVAMAAAVEVTKEAHTRGSSSKKIMIIRSHKPQKQKPPNEVLCVIKYKNFKING